MLQRFFALAATLALLLSLTACPLRPGSSEEEAEPTSSESASDENFPVTVGGAELIAAPETVVSLSPALTELVCDLGYAERLTGISDYCSYDDGVLDDTTRVGTLTNLDIGAVKRLKPGVVLTSAPFSAADSAALAEAGIPVAFLERASTVDALEALYVDTARALLGDPAGTDAGTALFEERMGELDAVRALVLAAGEDVPLVCYLRAMPLVLAGGDTFEDDLLTRAGFENCARGESGWGFPPEKGAELLPDVIFYEKSIGSEALSASELYNKTPAWQNKKCFALEMDVFERQGARMFALLAELTEQVLA